MNEFVIRVSVVFEAARKIHQVVIILLAGSVFKTTFTLPE